MPTFSKRPRPRHRATETVPDRLAAAGRQLALFIARQVILAVTHDLIHQILSSKTST